jgi:peroxiredoxin
MTLPGWSENRWLRAGMLAGLIAMWPLVPVPASTPVPAGKMAPLAFSLKDPSGKTVRLADYKGHPLVINFWATWCGPCKAEMPSLMALADKYRDRHLTVLGISVDDPPADLQKFAAEHAINYPLLVGLGHDELLDAFDASYAIPVSWFIRADGTVALEHAGPGTREWLDSQIQALFQ